MRFGRYFTLPACALAGLSMLTDAVICVPDARAERRTSTVVGSTQYAGHALEYRDFSDRDLTGASFAFGDLINVDFSGAVLAGADFSASALLDVDFSGAHLGRADFSGANFENVNFSHSILSGACFCNTRIKNTDFSNANLSGAVFAPDDRAYLESTGVDVRQVRWSTSGECARDWNASGWHGSRTRQKA